MSRFRAPGTRGITRAFIAVMLVSVAVAEEPTTQPAAQPIQATGQRLSPADVKVPRKDRTTLLLFLRAGQDQSVRTVKNAQAALRGIAPVQVLAVLSGKGDPEKTGQFARTIPWAVVMDEDYSLFGRFQVRVWPSTLVIPSDGDELVRLTGLPRSYAGDLNAYLLFATGKIDRKTLAKNLSRASTVMDTPYQMARRHLLTANRLLDRGRVKLAQQEVEKGLELLPADPPLLLAKARILLLLNGPEKAVSLLDGLKQDSPLAGEIGFLRGWALVAMGQWDRAIQVLRKTVRLNPDRSESYYLLGVAYQQRGLLPDAGKASRSAFEATANGQRLSTSLRASSPSGGPTTRPAGQSK